VEIRIPEEMVGATSSGVRGLRLRQFAVFGLKRSQRFGAALAWINVEREETRFFARRNTDICTFPGFPPSPDFRFIKCTCLQNFAVAFFRFALIKMKVEVKLLSRVARELFVRRYDIGYRRTESSQ
jgi:hypothetical protein